MIKTILFLWLLLLNLSAVAVDCPQWHITEAEDNIRLLSDDIAYHDNLYFKQNAPVISDEEYDLLLKKLNLWQACYPSVTLKDSKSNTVHQKYTVKLNSFWEA